MAVVNFELRLPFTGPKRLALIKSGFFLTELALFLDGGVAWDSQHSPVLKCQQDNVQQRIPVFSTGAALRVNLFGYMILEPYYAFPLQRDGMKGGVFGVNFSPGW